METDGRDWNVGLIRFGAKPLNLLAENAPNGAWWTILNCCGKRVMAPRAGLVRFRRFRDLAEKWDNLRPKDRIAFSRIVPPENLPMRVHCTGLQRTIVGRSAVFDANLTLTVQRDDREARVIAPNIKRSDGHSLAILLYSAYAFSRAESLAYRSLRAFVHFERQCDAVGACR